MRRNLVGDLRWQLLVSQNDNKCDRGQSAAEGGDPWENWQEG
jgi:hypothetical protein